MRWKDIEMLDPYVKLIESADQAIRNMPDDDLSRLRDAAETASETNCGWSTYRAAQLLLPYIKTEQHQRKQMRAAAPEKGVG